MIFIESINTDNSFFHDLKTRKQAFACSHPPVDNEWGGYLQLSVSFNYLSIVIFDEANNSFSTVSYLPYLKNGYFIQVIRLEVEKEVILWKPRVRGHAIVLKDELIRLSQPLSHPLRSEYKYLPEKKVSL